MRTIIKNKIFFRLIPNSVRGNSGIKMENCFSFRRMLLLILVQCVPTADAVPRKQSFITLL